MKQNKIPVVLYILTQLSPEGSLFFEHPRSSCLLTGCVA